MIPLPQIKCPHCADAMKPYKYAKQRRYRCTCGVRFSVKMSPTRKGWLPDFPDYVCIPYRVAIVRQLADACETRNRTIKHDARFSEWTPRVYGVAEVG